MLLNFGILQVLLFLSTECHSKNVNHKKNKTKSIEITIPITSEGIGVIRVDEISPANEYCTEPNVNIITTPIDYEPEIEEKPKPKEDILPKPTKGTLPKASKDTLPKAVENTSPEPIYDNNKINDTEFVPSEEQTFEGPVRASGTINILGNFGPTMAGDPFIYPMYRPVPLYPIHPALNDPNYSSESSEQPDNQEDPGTVNGGPYPFYRPVPLYPIFPSILRESASSEESELTDPVIPDGSPSPYYPMYRPPFFPLHPPTSNDPNQTTDGPEKSMEPLTLNDDTRRLLRNLMLLNVAHQSNIPCEVVPIPPTNKTYPEDETEPTYTE